MKTCHELDKVHIFLEGYKILQNLHLNFDWHYIRQKEGEDFAKILRPSQNRYMNFISNVSCSTL